MEDLWKDITLSTLSSLNQPSPNPTHPHQTTPHQHHRIPPNLTTTIFQDFLARPFSLDNHHHNTTTIPIMPTPLNNNNSISQPQTILSLNNTDNPPDLHLGDSSSGHSPPTYNPFHYTCSSAHQHKRRFLMENECDEMNSSNSHDRRHTRMIKNRESAARSRARKQAYTTELELQVAQLKKDNAELRLRMEQEVRNQAVLDQSPKNHKLRQTTSASF